MPTGGYSDLQDLSTIVDEVNVLVPIQRQTENLEGFTYEESTDTFRCPEGHLLKRYTTDTQKNRFRYRVTDSQLCLHCSHFGICTKAKEGRTVSRSFFEDTSQRIQQNLESKDAKAVYRLRAQRVEHPFGHLRRTLSVRSFLLRGLQGVKAEMSLYASAFNIRRMITLLGGVPAFVTAIGA